MALVRDIAWVQQAMFDTIFVSCSAILSTAGSTSPQMTFTATADALVNANSSTVTTGFGRTIDRLMHPLLTNNYYTAMIAAHYYASRGSTETNRQIILGVKLQHGDSSAAGDMADFSTGEQPADRTWFGTGRTSDMANWDASLSTGAAYVISHPAYYDLNAAKRYIRVAVRIGKNRITTESSGDEQGRVSACLGLIAADRYPQIVDNPRSPFSTTTTT